MSDASSSADATAAAPAPVDSPSLEVTASGVVAGAQLLMRSVLGVDAPSDDWTSSRSAGDAPPSPQQPEPASPARSRRTSAARSVSRLEGGLGGSIGGGDEAEAVGPPGPRNWDELSDLLKELHRNQLWFMYVFTSARESFQSGPQLQADSVQSTLDDLNTALTTTIATKRRMADIQRRVEATKARVEGWRAKQILREANTTSATVTVEVPRA